MSAFPALETTIEGCDAPESVVRRFWQLMASNNFTSVGEVLAGDYTLEWPQSNERVRGRDNLLP